MCNPPFHLGGAVHAGAAMKLFDAAARVLAPGGELWTVFNSTRLCLRVTPADGADPDRSPRPQVHRHRLGMQSLWSVISLQRFDPAGNAGWGVSPGGSAGFVFKYTHVQR